MKMLSSVGFLILIVAVDAAICCFAVGFPVSSAFAVTAPAMSSAAIALLAARFPIMGGLLVHTRTSPVIRRWRNNAVPRATFRVSSSKMRMLLMNLVAMPADLAWLRALVPENTRDAIKLRCRERWGGGG